MSYTRIPQNDSASTIASNIQQDLFKGNEFQMEEMSFDERKEQASEKRISVDDAINMLGTGRFAVGKWQLWLLCVLSAAMTIYGMGYKTTSFMQRIPKRHICKNDLTERIDMDNHWTYEIVRNLSTPLDDDGDFDRCRMFDLNYTALASGLQQMSSIVQTNKTVECYEWYVAASDDDMVNTVATEWNTLCSRSFLLGIQFNVVSLGDTISDIHGGIIVDLWGRKRTVLVTASIWAILHTLQGLSYNFYIFCAFRFLAETVYAGGLYFLGSELMPDRFRGIYAGFIWVPWYIGHGFVSLPAYWFQDWRVLKLMSYPPLLLFYIYFAFYLPESPRWLVAMGKEEEARQIIVDAAAMNGVEMPKNFKLIINESTIRVPTTAKVLRKYWLDLADTFKQPALLFQFFIFSIIGNIQGMLWWAVSFIAVALPGNMFFVLAFQSFLGIFDSIFTSVILHWGRKRGLAFCLLVAGLLFPAYIFVPESMTWLRMMLPLLAWVMVDVAGNCKGLLTIELLPVRVRTTSIRAINITTRIATLLSPYISTYAQQNEDSIGTIMVCFGGVCLFATLLVVVFLPETHRKPMADAFEEAFGMAKCCKRLHCCTTLCGEKDRNEDQVVNGISTKAGQSAT